MQTMPMVHSAMEQSTQETQLSVTVEVNVWALSVLGGKESLQVTSESLRGSRLTSLRIAAAHELRLLLV